MSHDAELERVNAIDQKDKPARYAELVSAWVKSCNIPALKSFVNHSTSSELPTFHSRSS
jgi:hypothetical protein